MLDSTLAELYGVEARVLIQAVKRNAERFPEDFMFQLSPAENDFLRSQKVILKTGRGQHRKFLPYVFTQEGVAMLSGVLRSPRAIQANIAIMRAFVRLRELLAAHKELSLRLDELEKKYDKRFAVVFEAIKKLMEPPPAEEEKPKGRMGFRKHQS